MPSRPVSPPLVTRPEMSITTPLLAAAGVALLSALSIAGGRRLLRASAFTVGNVVHAYWDLPAAGPAATSYLLNVTGSVTATVPMPTRSLHAPVPPGSYGLSVAAQNACGVSAFTAAQTAFVR